MSIPASNGSPPAQQSDATPPRRHQWPSADSKSGAILYAVIAGLIVYVIVDILPHVHVAVSYRR